MQIPDALTYEDAATLPCAAVTAWHALVSTATLGRRYGADAGHGRRQRRGLADREIARRTRHHYQQFRRESCDVRVIMGADDTINYKTTPEWDRRVRELTGKRA